VRLHVQLTRLQKVFVWSIDIGLIVYWCLIIFRVLPPEVMFEGYEKREVQAWNWSFFPLDILAAFTGIIAQTTQRLNAPVFLIISLVLTSVAGGMALAYWVVLGYYDILWWVPNLVLLVFPLWPLYQFVIKHEGS
jgi:hypothetical protein